jgi:hypothetical protein
VLTTTLMGPMEYSAPFDSFMRIGLSCSSATQSTYTHNTQRAQSAPQWGTRGHNQLCRYGMLLVMPGNTVA